MKAHFFSVPYDSAHRQARMGRGPERLLQSGLAQVFAVTGSEAAAVDVIESTDPFPTEIATSFALYRLLAQRVRRAVEQGAFPVVLGGNCGCSIGALAGVSGPEQPGARRHPLGVIWFDAHGDFNTPETTTSGFLDGMPLAAAAGLCWTRLTAAVPGFLPLAAANIIHLGGRDFDPPELELFHVAGAAVLPAAVLHRHGLAAQLTPALEKLRKQVDAVHIHLDLDVLDPQQVAPANALSAPGGLGVEQVGEALRLVLDRFRAASCTVASYDPEQDPQGRLVEAARALLGELNRSG